MTVLVEYAEPKHLPIRLITAESSAVFNGIIKVMPDAGGIHVLVQTANGPNVGTTFYLDPHEAREFFRLGQILAEEMGG